MGLADPHYALSENISSCQRTNINNKCMCNVTMTDDFNLSGSYIGIFREKYSQHCLAVQGARALAAMVMIIYPDSKGPRFDVD